jgi:hypothetical protein
MSFKVRVCRDAAIRIFARLTAKLVALPAILFTRKKASEFGETFDHNGSCPQL